MPDPFTDFRAANREAAADFKRLREDLYPSPRLHFGTERLTGRPVSFPFEVFSSSHVHIPGSSRTGKTSLTEYLARQMIRHGHSVILLDGKGDLYDRLLRSCIRLAVPPEKCVLINPSDPYCVGLNVLEPYAGSSPEAQAGLATDGLMKFFREDEESKVWLRQWLPNGLAPLSGSGWTMAEAPLYYSNHKDAFRDAVNTNFADYQSRWEELYGVPKSEQARVLQVIQTRLQILFQSPWIKAMLGQQQSTIDWRRIMDEGGIVLANLGWSVRIPPQVSSFIGSSILNQLNQIARTRPKGAPPVYVILDEFQKFLTAEIADMLDQLHGFGLRFILAHQYLEQLESVDPRIRAAVDANCKHKIVFSGSRKDAEHLYPEVFGDRIFADMQEVKDVIETLTALPHSVWKDVYSESRATSRGSGFAGMSGLSEMMTDDGLRSTDHRSRSNSDFRGEADQNSHSRIPGIEFEYLNQITSRTYRGAEEVKERLISWLHGQPQRHYYLKLWSEPAVPMVAPEVDEAVTLPDEVADYTREVYTKTARPIEDVQREIAARVPTFLTQHSPHAANDPVQLKSKRRPPATLPPRL